MCGGRISNLWYLIKRQILTKVIGNQNCTTIIFKKSAKNWFFISKYTYYNFVLGSNSTSLSESWSENSWSWKRLLDCKYFYIYCFPQYCDSNNYYFTIALAIFIFICFQRYLKIPILSSLLTPYIARCILSQRLIIILRKSLINNSNQFITVLFLKN